MLPSGEKSELEYDWVSNFIQNYVVLGCLKSDPSIKLLVESNSLRGFQYLLNPLG